MAMKRTGTQARRVTQARGAIKTRDARKSPGRPRKAPNEKLEQFSIRLPPKLKYGLELLARAQGRSLSQAIEWSLNVGLKSYEFAEESDYLNIGQLLDELWELPEHKRFLLMGHHARPLLTFEERAAADFVRFSEEYLAAWNYHGEGWEQKREAVLMLVERNWDLIKEIALAHVEQGISIRGTSLTSIDQLRQKRAAKNSAGS